MTSPIACVRSDGLHSLWFEIQAGVRQSLMVAADHFHNIDWLLERSTGIN